VPVDGGEETKVVDFLSYSFNFAVTAKGIYLLATRGGASSIELFDFATRKTVPSGRGIGYSPVVALHRVHRHAFVTRAPEQS
jgi:hypothetical protein